MKRQNRARAFAAAYTGMFLCVAAALLALLAVTGRSLIMDGDGRTQHFPAFVYLGQWLRQGLSGNGWKMVDFSLGQGLDVLVTLDYYCFTEPIAMLASLLPAQLSEAAFSGVILLRLYLAGLFTGLLALRLKAESWSAAAGGLMVAFGSFAVQGAFKHFSFGVGMMYLPLLLIAVERMFESRKWGLYVAVTALQLGSNFYFAFMNTVIAVLYILVRLALALREGQSVRKCAGDGFALLGGYLLGAALSAAVFLPVAAAFLGNGRTAAAAGYNGSMLHYPADYYLQWLRKLFGWSDEVALWHMTGYIPLAAFGAGMVLLSRRREWRALKIMLVLCAAMLCVPLAGKVMNGMGYVSNRWCYAFELMLALCAALTLPEMLRARTKKTIALAALLLAYAAVKAALMRDAGALVAAGLFALTAVVTVICRKDCRWQRGAVCLLAVVSVGMCSLLPFALEGAVKLLPYGSQQSLEGDGMSAFEGSGDGAFVRAAAQTDASPSMYTYLDANASALDYRGVSFYWSIIPAHVSDHYCDTWSPTLYHSYCLCGLGGDAGANLLASVSTMRHAPGDVSVIPPGYVQSGEGMLENEYALPLGYTFDSVMRCAEYDALTAAEKRDALLTAAVTDGAADALPGAAFEVMTQPTLFTLDGAACEGPIRLSGSAEVRFDLPEAGEVFLLMDGVRMDQDAAAKSKFIRIAGDGFENYAIVSDEESSFAYNQQGIIVSLGGFEAGEGSFVLETAADAAYFCEAISVLSRPDADYEACARRLGEDVMENVTVSVNAVSGTVSLEEPRWLQLSIPYSEGWTARVNGEVRALSRSGGMYTGLMLEAGEHAIVLRYETPLLREGCLISLAAALVCAALWGRGRCRRRKG